MVMRMHQKLLIYDSWFDNYLGALALFEFMMESIKKKKKRSNFKNDEYKVEHQVLSLMYPHPLKREDTLEIKQLK